MLIKLDYLRTLTDGVGILQHGLHSIPNFKEGYSIDDNARALIAVLSYHRLFNSNESIELAKKYLSFLHFMQTESGLFHNQLSFDKRYLDEPELQDYFGRALWACGFALDSNIPDNMKAMAKKLFDDAAKHIKNIEFTRPLAYTILGTDYYFKNFPDQLDLKEKIEFCAGKLAENYDANKGPDWKWFDDSLTYCNARLPQAMFAAHRATKNGAYLWTAAESMDFLCSQTVLDGMFVPIGQNGWFAKGGPRALFDQQPVEAASMVGAAVEAFKVTGNEKYLEISKTCFDWFFGKNLKSAALVDESNCACFDGLTESGPNQNQGAESTISYLLAATTMKELEHAKL